jgi:hypothetical protein
MGLADRLRQILKPPPAWTRRPEVLLLPGIPAPLHGMPPRVLLGQEWWDKERHAAYASTDFHCIACGVKKYEAKRHQHLEGHELYDLDYARGRMAYVETVPLCHYCHSFIHRGRLSCLLEQGRVTEEEVQGIIKHAERVIKEAGFTWPPKVYDGPIAEWKRWQLVIYGRSYPTRFKNQEAWEEWSVGFDSEE